MSSLWSGPAEEALHFFVTALLELTILFIGISFLVGLLTEVMSPERVRLLLAGKGGRGYTLGALLGALTPFCSCSTIPMLTGILKTGAGFGPAMAFLFTSPLVNPVVVPLLLTLLGLKITCIYTGAALCLSILMSYVLHSFGFARYLREPLIRAYHPNPPAPDEACGLQAASCPPSTRPQELQNSGAVSGPGGKCARIWRQSLHQFNRLFPYMSLGVAIGSLIHGYMPTDLITGMAGKDSPLAVPAAAMLGIPLYLRVTTMIPVAATLAGKGMSTGAVVALIIGGAGASLPEIAMLKGLFRLPLLLAFVGAVLCMAVLTGFLVDMVM